MKKIITLIFFTTFILSYGGGYYDIADDLRSNKLYDDAKREIIKIMYATKEDVKPQGYFLLGDIDAEKGDYEGAKRNWIKLKELYPKSDAFKNASEKAFLLNISLYNDNPKDNFELYAIKMGMKEKEFQDAKDDLKARLNKAGIGNVRVKGDFLSGELYRIEFYFENYASFDIIKNISGIARIEALKSYIDGKIDRDNYLVNIQKNQDGKVLVLNILDRKIYGKKFQSEVDKGMEELKKVEKEKIRPVKSIEEIEVEHKSEEAVPTETEEVKGE